MEKAGVLISRLQQQYNQQADSKSLLNTALLLLAELQHQSVPETVQGKVSIIMPYKPFETIVQETAPADEVLQHILENNILPPATAENDLHFYPSVEEEKEPVLAKPEPLQKQPVNALAEEKYNEMMDEIPTLVQQQPRVMYELNDTVKTDEPSINDKLKQQAKEAVSHLQSEPIKDLRKAIGINDKYVFIKELFRDDEVAYERSIKTINGFSILPEAEYWMQRELKYKLGWDDNNATVKNFYQLVRRRFS